MICVLGCRAWTGLQSTADFNLDIMDSDSEPGCSLTGNWPTIVEKLADFVHFALLNLTYSVFPHKECLRHGLPHCCVTFQHF